MRKLKYIQSQFRGIRRDSNTVFHSRSHFQHNLDHIDGNNGLAILELEVVWFLDRLEEEDKLDSGVRVCRAGRLVVALAYRVDKLAEVRACKEDKWFLVWEDMWAPVDKAASFELQFYYTYNHFHDSHHNNGTNNRQVHSNTQRIQNKCDDHCTHQYPRTIGALHFGTPGHRRSHFDSYTGF